MTCQRIMKALMRFRLFSYVMECEFFVSREKKKALSTFPCSTIFASSIKSLLLPEDVQGFSKKPKNIYTKLLFHRFPPQNDYCDLLKR